jgi:hypothetical protein
MALLVRPQGNVGRTICGGRRTYGQSILHEAMIDVPAVVFASIGVMDVRLAVTDEVNNTERKQNGLHDTKSLGVGGEDVVGKNLTDRKYMKVLSVVRIVVIMVGLCGALTACHNRRQTNVPTIGSAEWFVEVDSILGVSDVAGHGPDLDSAEWRRAVHRSLPDENSGLTLGDVGTDAWFRHVDEVVFWLHRVPRDPDWVYRRNLQEQTWVLEVWEPEGATQVNRWYRLSVDLGKGTVATVMHLYDGRIVGQWLTDLDGNGRREFILATQSFGTGAYGDVVLHELTGNRLQEVGGNDWKMPGEGYMGHDAITVSEAEIIRIFPAYLDGDSNSMPTGGKQLVRYCLQNGSLREADRSHLK